MQVGEIDCSHLEKKLAKQLRKKKNENRLLAAHGTREKKTNNLSFIIAFYFIGTID